MLPVQKIVDKYGDGAKIVFVGDFVTCLPQYSELSTNCVQKAPFYTIMTSNF